MDVPPFEHDEATLAGIGQQMASGALTARGLTEAYLSRIEALDPTLRSLLETNPEALASAEELDDERASGHVRGPLHGIPALVKDNIDTAEPMTTTVGSFALGERPPARDAFVVQRLRTAGAVILGKTNLSEWANFRSTRSSSGWSARGGQCRNPYVLDRNPCGSSSGSGVAVSANLCAVAVGTETDGSIVCPSSVNGIVGIKPTVGLVSRSGLVPISHTQDTSGPMARTVADAAALLSVLAGPDPRGAATAEAPRIGWVGDSDGLRRARVGVARNLAGFHDRTDLAFEEALAAMRDAGAEVIDPLEVPHAAELEDPELQVLLFEFKADLETYLLQRACHHRTLADLIAFNIANADREMPFFGQELFEQAAEKLGLEDPAYLEALATCGRLSRGEGLDVAFAQGVDAVVAPTSGPAWTTDHANGDHDVGGNSTPAAVAGYPSITVPMGSVFGLPVGISFIGPAWSEPTLIRLASGFEHVSAHRRPPAFLDTLA